MKRNPLSATIKQIQRWERLNAVRGSLSAEGRELLEWVEKQLIGPGMDRAVRDGLLSELLAAVRKRKKDTDSAKQVRAAYNSLMRKKAARTFRNWMKELEEMHSPLAERVVTGMPLPKEKRRRPLAKKPGDHYRHARTVRRIIKNELLPIDEGKPGHPKKEKPG